MLFDGILHTIGKRSRFDLATVMQLSGDPRQTFRTQVHRLCAAGKLIPLRRVMNALAENYRLNVAQLIICCCLLILTGCSVATRQAMKEGVSVNLSAAPAPDDTINPLFAGCDSIFCSCACDDPFDPRIRTDSAGVFHGKCLNTCKQRSALRLSPANAAEHGYFTGSDSALYWFVANIGHYDTLTGVYSFWVAKVPKQAVSDVIIQIEYAGGLWGHGQMRFVFDSNNPAILVPQRTNVERFETRVTDLVLSSEALAPPDIPYKGDWGFKKVYFIANRLATLDERAFTMIKKLHRQVWQFRLDLDDQQKAAVFEEAVRYATSLGHNSIYHTINNNCILALFDVLDASVKISVPRRIVRAMGSRTAFMPTRVPHQLKIRGLADRKKERFRLDNLEKELGWEKYIDRSLYE